VTGVQTCALPIYIQWLCERDFFIEYWICFLSLWLFFIL